MNKQRLTFFIGKPKPKFYVFFIDNSRGVH